MFTGHTLPDELLKNQATYLLHNEAKSGTASASVMHATAEVKWPECEYSTTGMFQPITGYAAGCYSVIDENMQVRADTLIKYLKANPSKGNLSRYLIERGLTESACDVAWKLVDRMEWDQVHHDRKFEGVKLKGEWRGLTGENYGSAKGKGWKPQSWTDDLDHETEDTLMHVVGTAKVLLEQTIGKAAIDANERQKLKTAADDLEAALTDETIHKSYSEETTEAFRLSKEILDKTPRAPADTQVPCPHCQKPLDVTVFGPGDNGQPFGCKIVKGSELTIDEMRKMQTHYRSVEQHSQKAALVMQAANKLYGQAMTRVAACMAAAARLEEIPETPADTFKVRSDVTAAELRLASFKLQKDARKIATRIENNQILIDALAPEGVRLEKLTTALVAAERTLDELSEFAGWNRVRISPDLQFSYGDRPFILLSESEQMRVRILMQVFMALLDGSPFVIVDRADMLDPDGRNGLFRLLKASRLYALVLMTIGLRKNVPVGDFGKSYWIEDGIAEEILGGRDDGQAA